MMHLYSKFETTLANFIILEENKVQKKFKKKYQHLFQPKIFSNLLKINQKNIIKLYEIDEINKTLTYEYFDSISLRECLKLNNNINMTTLKKILTDIAISIDYLHQHNIAHIDINDTNILINTSFEVKLNDFDFIEIFDKEKESLKQIDILSFALLVYRIIQLPYQWNSIKDLKLEYCIDNLDYSSCISFFNTLELR